MRPVYQIEADRTVVTRRLADRLISMSITDESGFDGDTLELVLDDRDWALVLPEKGLELKVWLGFQETGLYFMGQYVVDEIGMDGPPKRMTVRGRAANQTEDSTIGKMGVRLKEPRTRSWHLSTVEDIVTRIAAENGYEPRVSSAIGWIEIEHVDQTSESDMHFLTRLAETVGAVFKPAGACLVFAPKGLGLTASGESFEPLIELSPRDLLQWQFDIPDRGRYKSVKAFYADYNSALKTWVTAGEGSPELELPNTYASKSLAKVAAWSALADSERGKAEGTLKMGGNPILAAERPIKLVGFRTQLNARWTISRATHTYDSSGYTTEVELSVPNEGGIEL